MLVKVKKLEREKRLDAIVDCNLNKNYDAQELEMMIQVALLCTQASPEDRPTMSEVVRMLEGEGLAERWEEWQQVEVARRQEYERMQMRFDWGEDSIYNQDAIELSGGRWKSAIDNWFIFVYKSPWTWVFAGPWIGLIAKLDNVCLEI